MKSTGNMLIISVVIAVCLIAAQLAMSIPGRRKSYEIEPIITTSEYKTDAARAIDAYEQLMDRHMDFTEKHLQQVGLDCQAISMRLDDLSMRLARIERALGIAPVPETAVGRLTEINDVPGYNIDK